jgi:hypothetical protein
MVRARLCHSGPSGARAGRPLAVVAPLLPGRVWDRPAGSPSWRRAEWRKWSHLHPPIQKKVRAQDLAACNAGKEPRGG